MTTPLDPLAWRQRGFIVNDSSTKTGQLIPVEQGMSVLYGLNGAGKTRIIDDVERFFAGERSDLIALVQIGDLPEHIDFFGETQRVDWFRDWAARVRSDLYRPNEVLRQWVATCIQSESECEGFTRDLDPDRDFHLQNEWEQERLLLVQASGSKNRPEWLSAPAIITGTERPYTNGAVELFETLAAAGDELIDCWMLSSLAPYARGTDGELIMGGCVLGQPVLTYPQDTYSAGRHDRLVALAPRLGRREVNVNDLTVQHLQAVVKNPVEVRGDEAGPSTELLEAVQARERLANNNFLSALQDAPVLQLSIDVVGLSNGIQWHVEGDDPYGDGTRELRGLSSAQRKWSTWAITEAVAALSHDPPSPRLVVLDEPEAALHRSAESQASYLNSAASNPLMSLLVATHSPELLDLDQARLFEVTRVRGRRQVRRLPAIARESLGQLGLLPSDLLRRQRGLILVEGLHDQIVLEAFFGDELRELRTDVLPFRGTHQLSAAQMGFLFDFTPAHVFVMLDNIRTETLSQLWQAALAYLRTGDVQGALSHLDGAETLKGSSEGQVMRELLQRVVEAGNADRLTPHGLSKADVIEYLPMRAFVEGSGSWSELRTQHVRERETDRKRTPKDFKVWLRERHGADLSPDGLRHAIDIMDAIPADLLRLLKTVEAKTSGPPPFPHEPS